MQQCSPSRPTAVDESLALLLPLPAVKLSPGAKLFADGCSTSLLYPIRAYGGSFEDSGYGTPLPLALRSFKPGGCLIPYEYPDGAPSYQDPAHHRLELLILSSSSVLMTSSYHDSSASSWHHPSCRQTALAQKQHHGPIIHSAHNYLLPLTCRC